MDVSVTVALDRDELVGPDPTWERLPEEERQLWLSQIEDFPPPPLLLELMSRDLQFESYDPKKLAEKLSGDSVLTAHVLSRANSAAFGQQKLVTSLKQAMVLLGFNLVRSSIVRYQVEASATKLAGAVRRHIMDIQRSTDLGAVVAFNWAKSLGLDDPAEVATRCLLGRLGTFLLARRYPDMMSGYFAALHEPQRLNFEANNFNVTTRSLTYKVAQWWGLPSEMQANLFNLWTPLFSVTNDIRSCVACAGLALGFDPPRHLDDLQKWLMLRVHYNLQQSLAASGALEKLPGLIDNAAYVREMSALGE